MFYLHSELKKFSAKILTCCLSALLIWTLIPGVQAAQAEERLNNGQDLTRPVARFDLRYQYQNAPLLTTNDDTNLITLRMDKPFVLSDHWKINTRVDIPLMFSNHVYNGNPEGNFQFGLSDILVQALLINIPTETFAWAVGAQLIFPTATRDDMGAGKYRVVPTVALRFGTDKILEGSWVALAVRWDKDFAESRENSAPVNVLEFAPIINIPLPNNWFLNFFPSTDIRYNLGDLRPGDTGRWFVPFNFLVGTMLSEKIVASVEVGIPIIQQYQMYDFKVEGRIGFFF